MHSIPYSIPHTFVSELAYIYAQHTLKHTLYIGQGLQIELAKVHIYIYICTAHPKA